MERPKPSVAIGSELRGGRLVLHDRPWWRITTPHGRSADFSSLLSGLFHPLRPLSPQPASCLLVCLCLSLYGSVCLGLPQHGEAEEEVAKGGAAQQLQGGSLAFAHGQLLLQTGPEHLPGWAGLRAWTPPETPPSLTPYSGKPSETWVRGLRVESSWGVMGGLGGVSPPYLAWCPLLASH